MLTKITEVHSIYVFSPVLRVRNPSQRGATTWQRHRACETPSQSQSFQTQAVLGVAPRTSRNAGKRPPPRLIPACVLTAELLLCTQSCPAPQQGEMIHVWLGITQQEKVSKGCLVLFLSWLFFFAVMSLRQSPTYVLLHTWPFRFDPHTGTFGFHLLLLWPPYFPQGTVFSRVSLHLATPQWACPSAWWRLRYAEALSQLSVGWQLFNSACSGFQCACIFLIHSRLLFKENIQSVIWILTVLTDIWL